MQVGLQVGFQVELLVCLQVALSRKPGVADDIYESSALMEHPGIKGLMLTKQERIYELLLEYTNADGEVLFETVNLVI